MKPGKLRQLLSQYGELGRIYCTPEDQAARRQRKKTGGTFRYDFKAMVSVIACRSI